MSTSPSKTVSFSRDKMTIAFADGRELSVPIAWFPRLQRASDEEQRNWRLIGSGTGIHWPSIDEDVSVENLLLPASEVLWAKFEPEL